MNRLSRWLLALLMAVCACTAAAVPAFTGLVVDETGALDEAEGARLLERLQALQSSGRAQVAILVAAGTDGLPLSDYALQVAQLWALGREGRDDGLLVVVVPSQKAARLEVGYGLEGQIPDVQALRWIDDLLPALQQGQLAAGLEQLLDRIDAALPAVQTPAEKPHILDEHPEWKLPFVVVVFSPFALFPLFFGRWGAIASAPLFGAAVGLAAFFLWGRPEAAVAAGVLAALLPPVWALNAVDPQDLPGPMTWLRHAGNAIAVAVFFTWLMLFLGVALWTVDEARWGAPLFAGTMTLGLAVFLFPGRVADVLMVALRSWMHFLFVLILTYTTVMDLVPNAGLASAAIAGAFAGLVALSLRAEAEETRRASRGEVVPRRSLWFIGAALVVVLPVAVLLVVRTFLGSDLYGELAQLAAGGGSIGAVIWWAVRHGFFAALRLGLGGRFGGGGAEGRS
jgi:uncharacterized protein